MKNVLFCIVLCLSIASAHASGKGEKIKLDMSKIQVRPVAGQNEQEQLQNAAASLSWYEIEAQKLIDDVDSADAAVLVTHARTLIEHSAPVIAGVSLRLPQCGDYFEQSKTVLSQLDSISLEQLEADYHLDGALPQAPGECYHTKDLLIHPATVAVLARQDFSKESRQQIEKEIAEVLAHLQVVRQFIFAR